MDGTFVATLADKITENVLIRDGRVFTHGNWKEVPRTIARPKFLEIATLSGLKDFLDANIDELDKDDLILHVDAPDKVTLRGRMTADTNNYMRPDYVVAAVPGTTFQFGLYLDAETFTIGLM